MTTFSRARTLAIFQPVRARIDAERKRREIDRLRFRVVVTLFHAGGRIEVCPSIDSVTIDQACERQSILRACLADHGVVAAVHIQSN